MEEQSWKSFLSPEPVFFRDMGGLKTDWGCFI